MAPCPYIKKSRSEDRILIKNGTFSTLIDDIIAWDDTKDAIITIANYTLTETVAFIGDINDKYLEFDLMVLYDHPDDRDGCFDPSTSYGEALLLIIQRRSRLIDLSEALQKTDYYAQWPQEAFAETVIDRKADDVRESQAVRPTPSDLHA